MFRRKTIVKNAVKNVEFLSGEGDSLEVRANTDFYDY